MSGRGQRQSVLSQPENTRSYFQVPTDLYHEGDLLEEDLYFLYQGNYLLYRLKNLPWKKEDRKRLDEFGVTHLYIRCPSEKEHQRFLESHLSKILSEDRISVKEKAKILYSTSLSLVEEIYERPSSQDHLRRSMESIRHSIDYLSKDKSNFFELMSLAQTDFSEYTHALHTSAYAIALAQQVGIRAFNQISAIGIGSILHDIGKVKIDKKILAKEGKLNEAEREEVEKHSQYSYEIVHRSGTVPQLSELIILQHHERENGKGYPNRLTTEVHAFSKIVAVCDCFDLLTSERSYQAAMKPVDAIEYMRKEMKDELDQKLIVEFIRMLKR